MKKVFYFFLCIPCVCSYLACSKQKSNYAHPYPFYNNKYCSRLPKTVIDTISNYIPQKAKNVRYFDVVDCLDSIKGIQLWHSSYCLDTSYDRLRLPQYTKHISVITSSLSENSDFPFIQTSEHFRNVKQVYAFLMLVKRHNLTHLLPNLIDKVYQPDDKAYICQEVTEDLLINMGFTKNEITDIKYGFKGKELWIYKVSSHISSTHASPDYVKEPREKRLFEHLYSPDTTLQQKVTFIIATPNRGNFYVKTGFYAWDSLEYKLRTKYSCKNFRGN